MRGKDIAVLVLALGASACNGTARCLRKQPVVEYRVEQGDNLTKLAWRDGIEGADATREYIFLAQDSTNARAQLDPADDIVPIPDSTYVIRLGKRIYLPDTKKCL